MKKFFVVSAWTIAFLLIAASVLHFYGGATIASAPEVSVSRIPILSDKNAMSRGRYLANTVAGCADCHGLDFSGQTMGDGPPNARIIAPNLTSGVGGAVTDYSDETWVRAIAHGIGGDGRVLVIMPSEDYARMSLYDLGALIGYLKTLPAIDKELGPTDLRFPSTIILGVFGFSDLPVNTIDHDSVAPTAVNTNEAAYLVSVSGCISCHGKKLAGLPGGMGPPPGPNLTNLDWTTDQFIEALATGKRPDGSEIQRTMPWPTLRRMTKAELATIWEYVLAQPERPLGSNG